MDQLSLCHPQGTESDLPYLQTGEFGAVIYYIYMFFFLTTSGLTSHLTTMMYRCTLRHRDITTSLALCKSTNQHLLSSLISKFYLGLDYFLEVTPFSQEIVRHLTPLLKPVFFTLVWIKPTRINVLREELKSCW